MVQHLPWQPPEDIKELVWRRHVYFDALLSIRAKFKAELERMLSAPGNVEQIAADDRRAFEEILAENQAENRRVAAARKDRETVRWSQIEQETIEKVNEFLQNDETELKRKSREVEQMTAESKNFITAANVEEKLLQALENPVDYEYVIDAVGNVYKGNRYEKYLLETKLEKNPVSEKTAPAEKISKLQKVSAGLKPS